MTKEMLGAKVSPRTMERLERYADQEGISKSEATQRLVDKGLDVQESDMRLVRVRSDGGTVIENQLDSVEDYLESQSEKIEKNGQKIQETGQQGKYTQLVIGLAILWLGIQLSFNLPSVAVVPVSIGFIAAVLYAYYTEYLGDRNG